jgi:hypothetical protein
MELVETGNLVYGQDWEIINGVIEINAKALEQVREAQLQMQEDALAYKTYAVTESKTATLKDKETQFNREYADGRGWSKENTASVVEGAGLTAGGAIIGAGAVAGLALAATKIGGAIGTAIAPGIGTAAGAAIGAGIGAIIGLVQGIYRDSHESTDEESRALRVLQAEYEKVGSNSVFTAEKIK